MSANDGGPVVLSSSAQDESDLLAVKISSNLEKLNQYLTQIDKIDEKNESSSPASSSSFQSSLLSQLYDYSHKLANEIMKQLSQLNSQVNNIASQDLTPVRTKEQLVNDFKTSIEQFINIQSILIDNQFTTIERLSDQKALATKQDDGQDDDEQKQKQKQQEVALRAGQSRTDVMRRDLNRLAEMKSQTSVLQADHGVRGIDDSNNNNNQNNSFSNVNPSALYRHLSFADDHHNNSDGGAHRNITMFNNDNNGTTNNNYNNSEGQISFGAFASPNRNRANNTGPTQKERDAMRSRKVLLILVILSTLIPIIFLINLFFKLTFDSPPVDKRE